MEAWPDQILYLSQAGASAGPLTWLRFVGWFSVVAGVLLALTGAVLLQPRASVVTDMTRAPPPERGRKLLRGAALMLGAALIVIGVVQGAHGARQYREEASHAADVLNDVNRRGDDSSRAFVDHKIAKLNEFIVILQAMQQHRPDDEIAAMLGKAEKQRRVSQRIASTAAP